MGRAPRIGIPGIAFHVTQRGHDRSRVFFDDDDYRSYLLQLLRVSRRYETRVHAYVLMTNHVHLLMTSDLPNGVSLTVRDVAGTYARRINERQSRSGSLWEGRFNASPIDTDYYCLACYRYIELNPVRAGIVAAPGDYRWSSYRENTGQRALRIAVPHPSFLALGESGEERIRSYRSIMNERLPDQALSAIRRGTAKGLPVGRKAFVEQLEAKTGVSLGSRHRGRPRRQQPIEP